MALKDGIWCCDVCDAAIPTGQKRYPLDGGRVCCPSCWAEVASARPGAPSGAPADPPPVAQLVCEVCGKTIARGQPSHELQDGRISCDDCRAAMDPLRALAAARRAPDRTAKRPGATAQSSARTTKFTRRHTSGMAVASLVMGVLSFVLNFFCVGVITSLLAIALGALALSEMKRNPNVEGRGLAMAGLILGAVALLVGIIVVVLQVTGKMASYLFHF